jgi:hypothetical protein
MFIADELIFRMQDDIHSKNWQVSSRFQKGFP